MRVGVIQPSFIPWRGYFDFLASVDLFIFLDDVQYTAQNWRNRNQIKTPKGVEWLTVPVMHKSLSQLIMETMVMHDTNWQKKHFSAWSLNYRYAPYFDVIMELLSGIQGDKFDTISKLNIGLIKSICEYLGILTPMILSSSLHLGGQSTQRLINLLIEVGADTYLSGPSADQYLNKDLFKKFEIGLEYKSYDYIPYPQLWGEFVGNVTVLDVIANCGPEAKSLITSISPNKVII
jgi:hypothetical protein